MGVRAEQLKTFHDLARDTAVAVFVTLAGRPMSFHDACKRETYEWEDSIEQALVAPLES
ncbi:hypothetical protein BAUCODRAFT_285533 [Baudoinia panamericana UAMH 10762]|uniref:Uncharacterized protein n=1 Tax=Baudoinia panamericana (strain UAMH 10762) TaxID=717646 RepID=M2N071_BAUPA|nr:uncharacterized protein BAUCODRAFT_285533 [Baudoinia panamericana UAMH 10762]EMC92329.1 hypothetical protein BAUCODRAFT_285533 [Baudoinia panamericana UAMH 10762]